MTKKILHLQIPIKQNTNLRDDLEINPETLGKFMKLCQDRIGEDWKVISSPCIPSVSGDGVNFYNFDMNVISKDELLDLIKGK